MESSSIEQRLGDHSTFVLLLMLRVRNRCVIVIFNKVSIVERSWRYLLSHISNWPLLGCLSHNSFLRRLPDNLLRLLLLLFVDDVLYRWLLHFWDVTLVETDVIQGEVIRVLVLHRWFHCHLLWFLLIHLLRLFRRLLSEGPKEILSIRKKLLLLVALIACGFIQLWRGNYLIDPGNRRLLNYRLLRGRGARLFFTFSSSKQTAGHHWRVIIHNCWPSCSITHHWFLWLDRDTLILRASAAVWVLVVSDKDGGIILALVYCCLRRCFLLLNMDKAIIISLTLIWFTHNCRRGHTLNRRS